MYRKYRGVSPFMENVRLTRRMELLAYGEDGPNDGGSNNGPTMKEVGQGFMKNVAAGMNKAKDNLSGSKAGDTLKKIGGNIKDILSKIFEMIKNMFMNLLKFLTNKEKQMDNMNKAIDAAIANSKFGQELPDKFSTITAKDLTALGVTSDVEGTRCNVAIGYLQTVTRKSILEDVVNMDIFSKEAAEKIYFNITGQHDTNVDGNKLRDAVKKQLYVFENMEKNMSKQSKNKVTQNIKKVIPGKNADSLNNNAKEVAKMRKEMQGSQAKSQLEACMGILKTSVNKLLKFRAVDFLTKEGKYIDTLQKALAKPSAALQQQEEQQNSDNNADNGNNNNNSNNGGNNSQTPNGQSYLDELMKEISKAGLGSYSEGIFSSSSRDKSNGFATGTDDRYMNRANVNDQDNVIGVFFTEYSKAINNCIQNINQLYDNILSAGKIVLDDFKTLSKASLSNNNNK